MTRLYVTAAALAALTFPAAAQNTASEDMRPEFTVHTAQAAQAKMLGDMDAQKIRAEVEHMAAGAKTLTIQGGMMSHLVKGAPYSAEETSETTQALADGTRIHRETRTSVFRDGEGRLRRETPEAITIWDPVAGVSYLLDPKAMTAVKLSLSTGADTTTVTSEGKQVRIFLKHDIVASADAQKAQAEAKQLQRHVQVRTSSNAAETTGEKDVFFMRIGEPGTLRHETGKSESLGRQSMEGLTVEGTRETFTIEAGSIGNDRPIQVLSERWYSPDLQLVVSSRHTDPRSGEETLRITNVRRGEPGADRFQPSAAYKLIDHK